MENKKIKAVSKSIARRSRERSAAMQVARDAAPAQGLTEAIARLRSARKHLGNVMELVKERNELLRQMKDEG